MLVSRHNLLRVAPQFQPYFREIGLDAEAVFNHELIRPWRTLADRENCTLDFTTASGESFRWHVKRYTPPRFGVPGLPTTADQEVAGYRALHAHDIPTAPLVGWGRLTDGRSFVISDDLHGYDASDKLLADQAVSFEQLLEPTADLAAKLHASGLHHRDLYLCHFFARAEEDDAGAGAIDVRLIDVARVRPLRNALTRRRWIVKDLAQFWYSTTQVPAVSDALRNAWLERYASQRKLDADTIRSAIERKSDRIARHDQNLRADQPNRNISIPD